MVKLSIVVPVYNVKKYLKNCVDSLLKYKNDEIEIILIDDGSTDGSSRICDKYIGDGVKVIHQKNGGVSSARNTGIKNSLGKYIMFVDSDDQLLDNWDSVVLKECDHEFDVIYFSGKIKKNYLSKRELVDNILGTINNKVSISLAGPYSKIYKAKFLRENNINFKLQIINGEDALFNIEVLSKTDNYKIISKSIYKYFLNYSSATHRFDYRFIESNVLFLKELYKYLLDFEIFNESEVNELVEYSYFKSLNIWLYKISLLKNKKDKKLLLDYFNKKECKEFLLKYEPDINNNIIDRYVFKFLKNGKYKVALSIISLKSLIVIQIKKKKKLEWEII